MTEHSIEELKRQWKSAEDQVRTAHLRAREAKRRYDQARFEATGFEGCVAEFVDRSGKAVRFLPKRVSRWEWSNEIEGNLIRKDGTEGERVVRCETGKAKNLGPWDGEA